MPSSAAAPAQRPGSASRDAASAQPATPFLVCSSSPISPGAALPEEWLAEVFERARGGRCPRSRYVLASLSTNNAFPLPCRSWACETCQVAKARAARELLRRGMRTAYERGEELRFLTLTDGSRRGTMNVKELSAAWDKLAKLLRAGGPAPPRPARGSGAAAQERWRKRCIARRPLLDEYALVLEVGPRGGRLHAHALLTGRYIHQPSLSKWAKRSGFGSVVDIRAVNAGSSNEVAAYAGKLAAYGMKAAEEVAKMRSRANRRLRPLRTSRGWYPGGLRRVEADLGMRRDDSDDAGPWVLIRHDGDGTITSAKRL